MRKSLQKCPLRIKSVFTIFRSRFCNNNEKIYKTLLRIVQAFVLYVSYYYYTEKTGYYFL